MQCELCSKKQMTAKLLGAEIIFHNVISIEETLILINNSTW